MSNYRREMLELVMELHSRARQLDIDAPEGVGTAEMQERLRRQAEVLEFIVLHPEGLAELFKSQEEAEDAQGT